MSSAKVECTSAKDVDPGHVDVLYLGIGGVLQPSSETYHCVHGRDPFKDGHRRYEHAPLLAEMLMGWPEVRIVLTSVRPWRYGLPAVLEALGPSLAQRVIGCTFDDLTSRARYGKLQRHLSEMDYWRMSRASIVEKHLEWLQPRAWIAVDDETRGWTDGELARNVVLTPALSGLLDAEAQAKLVGLLQHQFGLPTEALPIEQQERPPKLHVDPELARQFAAAAASHEFEGVAPCPRVLVLGLEGTLFTSVGGTQIARPHLFSFLEACAELFERIVVFPEDHNQFRTTAQQLVDRGDAPAWLPEVNCIAWNGRTKDLERAGVFDLREVLLVDDKPGYVHAGQHGQWIALSTFSGTQRDWELLRVYELVGKAVQPESRRAEG